jgi:large subunit ribosomal protein L25
MEGLALKATTREVLGKKTRFLRRQGITPAHLFGHNLKSLTLQCDTAEIKRVIAQAGMTTIFNLELEYEKRPRKVLIREIQHDALGEKILHVDLYQIKMTEKLKADIPIVLTGEAPAMRFKGRLLMHPITTLSVECLPDKLPPEIEVDLSPLEEVDQAIHVSDLVLDPEITVLSDPEQLIVKISEKALAKEEVEEVAAVAAAAEVAEEEAPAAEEKAAEEKSAE